MDDATQKHLVEFFTKLRESKNSSNSVFPVNIDDIWPLCYSRKANAVRILKQHCCKGKDYIVIREQKRTSRIQDKNDGTTYKSLSASPMGGRCADIYYMSVSCCSYLISRRRSKVFDVYLSVFSHDVECNRGFRSVLGIDY